MVLNHVLGLLTHPGKEWESIRGERCSVGKCYCSHVLILSAIPVISGFIGTTEIGWQIGSGDPVKLTTASAIPIAILFYITLLTGVGVMGALIKWMAQTFDCHPSFPQAIALAAYTATPLYLAGLLLLYPEMWLYAILVIPVLGYTIFLLYSGVPTMMEISAERGFLFSSAILTAGMVLLVGILAASVILWGSGLAPAYTN